MKYFWFVIIVLISCSSHVIAPKPNSSIIDKWGSPHSWPAQIQFEGIEVSLRLTKRTQYGVSEIESADELGKNDSCGAHYYYTKDGKRIIHGPTFAWKPDGRIEEMGFIINGKLQYLYRFYPSGEVIHSKEYRKETNQVIFNWYEKNSLYRILGRAPVPTQRSRNV